ncbi:helix-turn-helix domain-containing protein [Herbaspirillum robiniae]|uniref:helix-turn-helix domain-containing protein n=1 Tax=Herbaspirillum robiniae TaxID=2014887 RepID=UPI003D785A54
MTFGQRLKEERKRLGMTQPDFAQVGKVEKNTQLNYEQDKRSPTADYLLAIADAGVDIHYVMHGERATNSLSAEETELVSIARQLSKEAFASVMALANSLAPNRHKHSLTLNDAEQAQVEEMARSNGVTVSEMLRSLAINQAKELLKEPARNRTTVTVHGQVGQQINGDIHGNVTGPSMGKNIVKKK